MEREDNTPVLQAQVTESATTAANSEQSKAQPEEKPVVANEKVVAEVQSEQATQGDSQVRASGADEGAKQEEEKAEKATAEGESEQIATDEDEEHELQSEWTFWYVYMLSHREKRKIRKARYNEYQLHEVYSFNTVSRSIVLPAPS